MELRIFFAVLIATLHCTTPSNAEWNDPLGQYHIQTDEGPERYFRYQTNSGQYRKEKRLEDGTVVGTDAWIDANGYLRQKDYIADNEGYRILRSKHVYVGFRTPIEEAIKVAKKAPVEAGILAGRTPHVPSVQSSTTTTESPIRTYVPNIPDNYLPSVQITPNANPYQGYSVPSHVTNLVTSSERPIISIPSTTQAPIYGSSTPSPISSTTYSTSPILSTLEPPLASNDVYNYHSQQYHPSSQYDKPTTYSGHYNTPAPKYSGAPQFEHYDNPYIHQNGPTYPIDKYGNTFNGQSNTIGNGYDPQYPEYDGVSVTNDGFRYYIPRAYHEEQSQPGNKKSGSFGYVDPFGIRRVIYYNASPEGGFQHRKNNRYVGLNATPYDPRPY